MREFGTEISDEVEVRVHDSTVDFRYFALPQSPAGTEHLTEGEPAALIKGNSMVGVTVIPEYYMPEEIKLIYKAILSNTTFVH